jgi:hypothetical protein
MTDTAVKSDVITIKEFFGMTTVEARNELAALDPAERSEIADAIRAL